MAGVTPDPAAPAEPAPAAAGAATAVRLRAMTTEDAPAVLRLERSRFPTDAWSEHAFHDELSHGSRHYVVACDGDRIVGYAGLRAVPPEADVQTIAVEESDEGRGIGARLLGALLDEAAARGSTEVFLDVRADNPRAKDLYKRFGFEQVGLRRGYYVGADAIVMRRSAPAAPAPDAPRPGAEPA